MCQTISLNILLSEWVRGPVVGVLLGYLDCHSPGLKASKLGEKRAQVNPFRGHIDSGGYLSTLPVVASDKAGLDTNIHRNVPCLPSIVYC